MQTLHFAILPYRNSNGEINSDYVYLSLVDEQGNRVESESISKDAWRERGSDFRDYWKHTLLTCIYRKLSNYSKFYGRYSIADTIYDEWYRWYFFINGKDAREFIVACQHSQHSSNFQSMIGVTEGWKYFKVLKGAGFNTSTAAMLAYSRGYIDGMNLNAPWDREGDEALACLGLRKA
jgi:hypothetical protein